MPVGINPLAAVTPVRTAGRDHRLIRGHLLDGEIRAVVAQGIQTGVSSTERGDELFFRFQEVIVRHRIVQLFIQVGAGIVEGRQKDQRQHQLPEQE